MMIKLLVPALLATAEAAFFAEPKIFGDWDLVEPVEPDTTVKYALSSTKKYLLFFHPPFKREKRPLVSPLPSFQVSRRPCLSKRW